MLQFAMTGKHPAPMPARDNPWAVYDVFTVKDGEQIFLAAVSDSQWKVFCAALGYADLYGDERLLTNNDRVRARDWLIPLLRERLASHGAAELSSLFEKHGLPFAPITRPEDLFEDAHLQATGGLAPMTLPDGRPTRVPLLPLTLAGHRPELRLQPPRLNEHGPQLLRELAYTEEQIARLTPKPADGT